MIRKVGDGSQVQRIHQHYFHYTVPRALHMQMQPLFAPPMSFPMTASGFLWCAVNFGEL